MKQSPEGLPVSSPRAPSRFSSPISPSESGSGDIRSYHKREARRAGRQPAAPEKSLEFSAGLKTLDFPTDEQLYERALDGAIELLQADGGVLAMLDPTGQRLVIRKQRLDSVLEAHYAALAALGRSPDSSISPSHRLDETQAPELQKTQPLPILPLTSNAPARSSPSKRIEPAGSEGLDPTADPSGKMANALPYGYACGQGLLGYIWQLNRAVALPAEKCRALPRDETTPPDQDASWHIGAPLRVPEPLLPLPADEPAPVVGVITVAIREKHWTPTKRHTELLQLHADRVALALQTAWLEETRYRQARFLRLLHDATLHFSTTLDQEQLFTELHQLAVAVLGSTSFAILLYHEEKGEIEFAYVAEREGATRRRHIKEGKMPAWWLKIKSGEVFTISTPEERQEHAGLLRTGWLGDTPFEAMLIVPLFTRAREHLIGALGVASRQPRLYTREQVEMLETIAQTTAFAFENADLYVRSTRSLELVQSSKRQVAALNNAVSTLNSSLHLDEILSNLVKQATLLTKAQVCTVCLFEGDGQTVVARASNASERHFRTWSISALEELRFKLADEMIKTLNAGERIILDDLETERASQTPLGDVCCRFDIHSLLLVPIIRQELLLGMLAVYTPGERHIFKPEEIALLEGLAGQAAVAIHNAQLYMELEQALEQQKELDRLKDDFIVTASHEFRTPLSAIHGYASLLQRHSARLTPEQARRFSTEITRAAQQLVGMVTTLMDASRLDSRKLSLSLQPVEVRPLAESALALIQPDIQQPIRTDIPAGLWVYADQERLRQVMTNLLTNAGKYSPPSSPIDFIARIERQFTPPESALPGKQTGTANVPLRPIVPAVGVSMPVDGGPAAPGIAALPGMPAADAAPAGYVVFSVVDRGEGISLEDQKKLFQKFVRLQRSLTTPVRGTGLGLYICRQYLTAMGGYIWVESTPGQGSTFSFALPLMPPPADSAGKLPSPEKG